MWSEVAHVQLNSQRLNARWIIASDYVKGPWVLRFKASGRWEPFGGFQCDPDGTSGFPLAAERMVVTKGAPGCLIGKLGGSSASLDETGSTLFAIGSYAVIAVPDKFAGPLFVGFNLERSQIGLQIISLDVLVEADSWPFPPPPSQ